jgi:23S rRNA (guanine2445-N2)-methyltransferase / 23S rRNA (guanine2069-N7)-methyltransferase
MCGSGTFLTEAALMYGDVAPGLMRDYFGFLAWQGHDQAVWEACWQEARQRQEQGEAKVWPMIQGYDADPEALTCCPKKLSSRRCCSLLP